MYAVRLSLSKFVKVSGRFAAISSISFKQFPHVTLSFSTLPSEVSISAVSNNGSIVDLIQL
jgi:hypothetical protein